MNIKDLESPHCRIIENFISKEDCDWLIKYSEESGLWSKHNRQRQTFKTEEDYKSAAEHWDNRRIEINELYREGMENYKDLFKFVVPIQEKMEEQVKDFFKPDFEIYSELWEIVKWYYPHLQEPHVDFIDPNFDLSSIDLSLVPEQCKYFFEEKNISEYKRLFTNKIYTSMLYLNDNFEGGELFFPQHNEFSIKPKAGMLLIFSGDINTMHGIRQITSGNRYTHTTFWTKDLYKSSLVAIDKKRGRFMKEKLID
jgi:hypothetical protein